MFSLKPFLVTAFLLISGCICESEIETPCKINDNECADKLFAKAGDLLLTGAPSLFIDSVDPLFFDLVEGNLTIVNYKLLNSTLTGYKNCKLLNAKTDFAASKLHLEIDCPSNNQIVGKFEINGRIYSGIIAGTGDYDFSLGAFKVNLETYFAKRITKDGNIQLNINSFLAKATVKTPLKASFQNLVSSDRSKFTPENWKAVGDILQEPLMFASFKKILKNMNVYLKTLVFEN